MSPILFIYMACAEAQSAANASVEGIIVLGLLSMVDSNAQHKLNFNFFHEHFRRDVK